jgi:hypothetical protein
LTAFRIGSVDAKSGSPYFRYAIDFDAAKVIVTNFRENRSFDGLEREVAMLRVSGLLVALELSTSAAIADRADRCDAGIWARACTAQSACLSADSRLRAACDRHDDASRIVRQRIAEQCGASIYRCPGTCCYSTSRGYYCADSNGDC